MDSPDLQVKYHKLASEYSKLRAQNQVLKKAVIEEQGKNTQYKDSLKIRDQSLRKAEQEIDSLTFRNQQLTKRFSLLQEDLELIKNKPRRQQAKHDSPPTNSVIDNNVYIEELESKIQENARLHAELTELEVFYKNKVLELEMKLDDVSKEAAKSTENIRSQEQILQSEIKKLENERVLQEVTAQQREAKIVSMQNHIKSLKGSEQKAQTDDALNGHKLGMTNNEQVPVNFPNSLQDKSKRISDGKLIRSICDPIHQLSCGFIDFFSSYSDLLQQSSSLSPVQVKLAGQLSNEQMTWNLLFKRYEELCAGIDDESVVRLESLVGLDAFSKVVANCASSLRKLIPVLSEKWLCFQEGQIDAPWRSTLGRLVSCWAAITPYLASLSAYSDGRTALLASAIWKILNLLHERITKLHLTSQELLTAWDLLNVEDRKREEAVKKSLCVIEQSFSKICVLFSENTHSTFTEGSSYSSSPSSASSHSPVTAHIVPHPGLSLLSSPDSSGWSGTVPDGLYFADSEASLAQQLAQATSRLSKLEEEREHWRLEYQLLSHRFDKETKKCEQLEKEMKALKTCPKDTPTENGSAADVEHKAALHSSTSLIGEVVGSLCSVEEREKEIRDHFTNRCSHLYMQLTSCTSQAALYQNECETLIRRLTVCEESRVAAEQHVEKLRRDVAQLQETLSTTSRNYEEQISTMSDHLADLNEKITSQADSIEQLKFELKRKGKK